MRMYEPDFSADGGWGRVGYQFGGNTPLFSEVGANAPELVV